MKKIVLIDGNALVHRAFHALPPLTSPKGMITNAVFGFSSILMKMMRDLKPEYIAATFDLAGPTIRHEGFAEYKAHRQKAPQELYDQIPLVKTVVEAFGIPIYEQQGYEADDLIGTLVEVGKKEKDLQIIVATGDLDTLQLVEGTRVQVFTLRKGVSDTVTYDEQAIRERYDLAPHQLCDYRGLKGDPSDNIPGVPGIGEKTAITLIKEFGSLEHLYDSLTKEELPKIVTPKLKEKLLEHRDLAFLSKELSRIYTDLEIDFSLAKADWQRNMNRGQLETIFKDLGFASLIRRINELPNTTQSASLFDAVEEKKTRVTIEQVTAQNIEKILEKIKSPLALQGIFNDQKILEKISFAYDSATVFSYTLSDFDDTIVPALRKVLEDTNIQKIGHDIKPLFKALRERDITMTPITFDTNIAGYLVNPDGKNYEIETLYYGLFDSVPDNLPLTTPAYVIALAPELEKKLAQTNQEKILKDIEIPLLPVLGEMELRGIAIDQDLLKDLLKSSDIELKKLEKEIYSLAGKEFNINSPAQLGVILYDDLAIKGKVKKTTGGARSTAAPELEKLRDEHPIIDFILQYRELQKLKTTYIEPFPHLIAKDGRIHTTYDQAGAATGRLASKDPNLQNIPTRTELGQQFRKAFIARDGYDLVACDYSQLELRIAAHLAHDEKMIETFKRGEDIHTRTAAEIFGVSLENVTKDMRRHAKTLNFGVLYGMGPVAFSKTAKVSMAEAKSFIERYFQEFAGITRFIAETKKTARQLGYTETMYGRRRNAVDLMSTMPQLRAQAERMAVNHPVQGTEADLIKLAMIEIDNYLKKENLEDDVRMLLQVHDELVFEIKKDFTKKIAPVLGELMTGVADLDVPLTVDLKTGSNWAEMKKI